MTKKNKYLPKNVTIDYDNDLYGGPPLCKCCESEMVIMHSSICSGGVECVFTCSKTWGHGEIRRDANGYLYSGYHKPKDSYKKPKRHCPMIGVNCLFGENDSWAVRQYNQGHVNYCG